MPRHLPARPIAAEPRPSVAARSAWQAELDQLLAREKAHMKQGDAIAALRRRLPMTPVPPSATIVGADGEVPFVEAFDGRRMLAGYFHMWHDEKAWEGQCEGCTVISSHIQVPLAYLHQRDVTLGIFCEGTYEESAPYAEFLGYQTPWWSARDSSVVAERPFGFYAFFLRDDDDNVFETYWTTGRGTEFAIWSYDILDRTVYGRQESWQDSPTGWPTIETGDSAASDVDGRQWRVDGRPTVQWQVTDVPAGPDGR